jgi:hypothetical protein
MDRHRYGLSMGRKKACLSTIRMERQAVTPMLEKASNMFWKKRYNCAPERTKFSSGCLPMIISGKWR